MRRKLLTFVLAISVLSGCGSTTSDTSKNDITTSYLKGSFVVDVNSPAEVIGDADYVFVATVNDLVGTEYKDPVSMETETGSKEVATPYTNYKVIVTDNIKGELQKNTEIELQKFDGLSSSKDQYLVFEDDVLPQVGKTYIFVAYAQDDGSLLVSGPNSNILLNPKTKSGEKLLSEYEEAYESQIETTRERSVSKYDVITK